MDYVKCSECGASIPKDDATKTVGFCTFCGAKFSQQNMTGPVCVSDSVILDYYVNAVESEIFCNKELAIQNYKKILEYRPGFSPAQRGLSRLKGSGSVAQDDNSNNVTVNFSSVKPYALTVEFENCEDDDDTPERKALVLMPGEKKSISLKPVEHRVVFRIGRKAYSRFIDFEDATTCITIDYLFDGWNHINIVDDCGNDMSDNG